MVEWLSWDVTHRETSGAEDRQVGSFWYMFVWGLVARLHLDALLRCLECLVMICILKLSKLGESFAGRDSSTYPIK